MTVVVWAENIRSFFFLARNNLENVLEISSNEEWTAA